MYFGKEKGSSKEIFKEVDLKKLPNFSDLSQQVDKIVKRSTWWELYGIDWLVVMVTIGLIAASLVLMQDGTWWRIVLGTLIFGFCQYNFAAKTAHSAAHGAVVVSPKLNQFFSWFFTEFAGSFSYQLGHEIHIKVHHPHTNIIGLGDSSTWKAPFVPAYLYMFVTPMLVPIMTPLVSVAGLFGRWSKFLQYIVSASTGLAIWIYLLMAYSGYSFGGAALCLWIARGIFSVPYIHVNIFQHIGLSMYSQKNRPKRIYQMATGVLNLSRNPILDYCFGHSIVSCHVEHHLFPRLSDHMCLRIKPLVSKFLKENGLPYNEDTYFGRVKHFLNKYEELMVNAPPITHFVGLQ